MCSCAARRACGQAIDVGGGLCRRALSLTFGGNWMQRKIWKECGLLECDGEQASKRRDGRSYIIGTGAHYAEPATVPLAPIIRGFQMWMRCVRLPTRWIWFASFSLDSRTLHHLSSLGPVSTEIDGSEAGGANGRGPLERLSSKS